MLYLSLQRAEIPETDRIFAVVRVAEKAAGGSWQKKEVKFERHVGCEDGP
jgi:hypothetical protein